MAAANAEIPVSKIGAFTGLPGKAQALGAFSIVLAIEIFLLLAAEVNPGILPGNWTPEIPFMEYYILASFLALLLLAFSGLIPPGTNTLETFLARFAAGSSITWLAVTLLFFYSPHPVPLAGGVRIQTLMFTGFFIAPVEELLFRVALPPRWGWFWGSSVAFAAFHIPIYLLTPPGSAPITVAGFLGAILQPAIMGVVLWYAYRIKPPVVTVRGKKVTLPFGGLPFSMGIHFIYDIIVYGALIALPLGIVGLGLTPI